MSSPKRAAKTVAKTGGETCPQRRRGAAVRQSPPSRSWTAPRPRPSASAAVLERGIVDGKLDMVTAEALQKLIAAACRVYTARTEAGEQFMPVPKNSISATDVMVTASGLLTSHRSRRLRARHVAELDGPLTPSDEEIGTPGETLWISLLIAAAA